MEHLRLALSFLLFIAFFFLPWWALFLLALPGLLLYRWYGEILVLGFAIDILFRDPSSGVAPLWATLLALLLLFLSHIGKRGLRFQTLAPYVPDTR